MCHGGTCAHPPPSAHTCSWVCVLSTKFWHFPRATGALLMVVPTVHTKSSSDITQFSHFAAPRFLFTSSALKFKGLLTEIPLVFLNVSVKFSGCLFSPQFKSWQNPACVRASPWLQHLICTPQCIEKREYFFLTWFNCPSETCAIGI